LEFPRKHLARVLKRCVYSYFLREMNLGSVQLVAGAALFLFGVAFGGAHWLHAWQTLAPTPAGTIMLAALPTLLGFQLLLGALSYDVGNVPRDPLQHSALARDP
jgi:hypothetical protein